jgi:hypothetical protein
MRVSAIIATFSAGSAAVRKLRRLEDGMRRTGGVAVNLGLLLFIAYLLVSQPRAVTDDSLAKVHAAMAALRADLESGRIVRANIFRTPYHILTPVAVTPDMLKAYSAHHKGDLRIEMNRRLVADLVRAIDGARLQPDKWHSDLRWGATFFDQYGLPLHSIHLNSCYHGGAGRQGYIDGIRVRLNDSLIIWFQSNFSNGAPVCAD